MKKSLEITAVTGAILRVLRAFDFFQQIKLRQLSSQREKFRVCCAELFLFKPKILFKAEYLDQKKLLIDEQKKTNFYLDNNLRVTHLKEKLTG